MAASVNLHCLNQKNSFQDTIKLVLLGSQAWETIIYKRGIWIWTIVYLVPTVLWWGKILLMFFFCLNHSYKELNVQRILQKIDLQRRVASVGGFRLYSGMGTGASSLSILTILFLRYCLCPFCQTKMHWYSPNDTCKTHG